MADDENPDELAAKARFVFRGTVQRLNAATIPEVHDTSNTAVVRVNETIHAPKALSHYDGRDITVKLAQPGSVKAGDEAVFFTDAWLFGNQGVAVSSLGHRPPGPQTEALRAVGSDPVTTLQDRDTRAHYDGADSVVSGRVVGVRLPAGAPAHGAPREHDPHWREAVVEVDRVHKGIPEAKQVVVRFPASSDRMWHGAPKLVVGSRGTFMLHRVAVSPEPEAIAAGAPAAAYFEVRHPEDFEADSHPGPVRKMLNQLG